MADLQGGSVADQTDDHGEKGALKTGLEILREDPEFWRRVAVEALVAEASEVTAGLMAQQNLSRDDFGETAE